jgi:nucleoside-diphosphate-sugar epimerase
LWVRTTGRRPKDLPNYLPADVLRPENLERVLEGIDSVVHAAGAAHRPAEQLHEPEAFAANVRGVENIMAAAARAGVKHVTLISSVSVYGPHHGPASEDTPCRPDSAYGQSKLAGEHLARHVAEGAGFGLAILRLATVYGEGDPGNIGRLMRAIDRGRFIWVGPGANHKSLIDREDVARACLAVVQSPGTGIRTFNVSASPCTMNEVVEGLAAALRREIRNIRLPASLAFAGGRLATLATFGHPTATGLLEALEKWLSDDVFDGQAFQNSFGYAPEVPLVEGLRRQVAAYRRQNQQ